jgi:predicted nucleotidyltransferase component of viral defense system
VSRYATPAAFKQALEQRLRSMSKSGLDFARRRQLLVFNRFLARIMVVFGDAVILKGGLVIELRLERARTTKDIDLRLVGSPDRVLDQLQAAGRMDLGDFMTFEVTPDAEHPEITNEGMKYEGRRHRAEARIAGKLYGQPFGVDVAFADPLVGEPDIHVADDVLAFHSVPPPTLRLYPIETHLAEKLHAYTMPRSRPNTRVKDLPDLALLASVRDLTRASVRAAIDKTFEFRGTHPVPTALPTPPTAWEEPYAAMAAADALAWPTLIEVHRAAAEFLDPVLADSAMTTWSAARWSWSA